MIIRVKIDKQKAKALIGMAKITLERLNETREDKYPTNTLKDYYDVIHEIMEALACIRGIKTKGDGAHQELIDYVCKEYKLNEGIRIFIQEIREFRNRISSEGFIINPGYITLNNEKIKDIISILIKLGEFD